MIITLLLIALLTVLTTIILKQPRFGKFPQGKRLLRIKQSPNYKNGYFQNKTLTPVLTEGTSYWSLVKSSFFEKHPDRKPTAPIPSQKTNLLTLDKNVNQLVWFGHSSYFMQIDGKTILVDPVFSGYASPFSFSIKAFAGTDRYTIDDLPEIDYLFITHDHWDHLDHTTISKLNTKVKKVICGLGVGEHLEHWGYEPTKIEEHDWDDHVRLAPNFDVFWVSTRHFSGRGLKRNKTLCVAYVLKTPYMQIFIGGDGGYDTHFAEIGVKFGTFDLVILENGQNNEHWKYIHMNTEEVLKATSDLNAKCLFPIHSSKFALAHHAWFEPLEKIIEKNQSNQLKIITPMIGEKVDLNNTNQTFKKWWKSIE